MNEVKELFKKLATDPKGKELLKAAKEPETAEEAADLYLGIAKELGVCVSREDMLAFVQAKEKAQRLAAEKAAENVKEALDDSELDNIAGGVIEDATCESSVNVGEWCWFSDGCSYIINSYSSTPDEREKYADFDWVGIVPGWDDVQYECGEQMYNIDHGLTADGKPKT